MENIAKFQPGQKLRITGTQSYCHCFENGDVVTVVRTEFGVNGDEREESVMVRGSHVHQLIDQWVHVDELEAADA